MLWLLVIIILALIAYLKYFKPLNHWEEKNIPYLKPWPLLGNMSPFIFGQTSLYQIIESFYNNNNSRYFGLYNFCQPILMIRDVELAKTICIKEFDHFVDHKNFFNETNEPVFSENLFAAKGQQWRELRATVSPVFTGSKMRSMFILISECAERFNNHFLKTIKDKPLEVEIRELFKRFSVDVIGTCACGIESNCVEDEKNDFYQNVKEITDFSRRIFKTLGFLIMPKLMRFLKVRFFSEKQINFFQNIVSTTIAYREKHGIVRPDLLHIMMQARKGQLKFEDPVNYSDAGFATIEESEVGKNFNVKLDITDKLIIAQVMVFFLGGIDTNSTLLSITAYELAVNTDVQKKLQKEIDATFAECNGHITYEILTKLKYLDMVVSECLRKWPQAFFLDRICNKDYTIKAKEPGEKDFVIEKGQICWIPVIGYHRDPKYYTEPERFDPERFNDENKQNMNPYAYLPFGQGPRSCIGNRFALLVTKIIIFYVLHHFNFIVTKKTDVPFKISKSQILFYAKNGFWMGLQKRASNN